MSLQGGFIKENRLPYDHRRPVAVYKALMFLSGLGFGTVFTLNLVYHVVSVKLNPLQLVLVGTTLEATIFLCETPTGMLADRYSRRLSVILGYFLIGLGFCVEGLFPSFDALVAAQVIWGIGYTFTSGAQDAWIADEIGAENAVPVFLRGAQAFQAGRLAGVPASVLLSNGGLYLPVVAGGILFVMMALGLCTAMPEKGFDPPGQGSGRDLGGLLRPFQEGLRFVWGDPLLIVFCAALFLCGFSSEGYERLWTAFMVQEIPFPYLPWMNRETWFGAMAAVAMLLTFFMTGAASRRASAFPLRSIIVVVCFLSGIVCLALFLLAGSYSFAVALMAYWMIETARALMIPLNAAWLNRSIPSSSRATVLSMTNQFGSLGQIAGGPFLGWLGLRASVRTALLGSGVLFAPVFLAFLGMVGLAPQEVPDDRDTISVTPWK